MGVSLGGQLQDMADRTGIAASQLSRLSYIADEGSVAMEDLEKVVRKIQITLGDANPEIRKTLHGLGLNLAELRAMDPDQQFIALGSAIAGIEDPARRAVLAQKLMGKQAATILPMFAKGRDAFLEAAAGADRLNAVLGDHEVKALHDLGVAWGHSKKQLMALAASVAAAVAGPLTSLLEIAQSIVAVVIDLTNNHPILVASIAAVTVTVAALSAAAIVLGTILTLYEMAAWTPQRRRRPGRCAGLSGRQSDRCGGCRARWAGTRALQQLRQS